MLLIATLEQAIELSARNGAPLTLLAIDIDHFKKINDRLGHAVGDQVLIGVAAVLKRRVRQSDVTFRLGGEEFLCLLYDCDGERGAEIAETIRAEVMESRVVTDLSVTASFGVASADHDEGTGSWLKRVDDNLYEAKSLGRNRVVGS